MTNKMVEAQLHSRPLFKFDELFYWILASFYYNRHVDTHK